MRTFLKTALKLLMHGITLKLKFQITPLKSKSPSFQKTVLKVLTTIAGYIVKKINKKLQCNDCKKKLIASSGEKINDEYLALLSRGGLTFPQKWFADYCASIFCALSISESIIQRHSSIVPRHAARYIITEYVNGSMQSCNERNVKAYN